MNIMMSRLRDSIQIESRSPFPVIKFPHLEEVPVAESSWPTGGKYTTLFQNVML